MAIGKKSKPARGEKGAKEPKDAKRGKAAARPTHRKPQALFADTLHGEAPPAPAHRNDETTRDGFRATPREDRAG